MKQYEADIRTLFSERLQQRSDTVSFDSVWDRYERERTRSYSIKRAAGIPMIALITLVAVFTVGFAAYGVMKIADNTNYPFVDDQRVIGRWESVDFVSEIEQFNPGKKAYGEEMYLTSMIFLNGGDTLFSAEGGRQKKWISTWTRGMILNKDEKTAEKYEIKEIDGNTYMFLEWKSGDYTIRGMKPQYYVLKKVDSELYTHAVEQRIEDKLDYPFVNDPEILGSWQSVDFVETIKDFEPGIKSWLGDLWLAGFDIMENGEIDVSIASGRTLKDKWTWTKGLILDKQDRTAEKYETIEIAGETYMFLEWKSGDYMYGRSEPSYYVLKKVE